MHYRAVIFDLFGTLIPKWQSARGAEVQSRMAQLLGLPFEEFTHAWRQTLAEREVGCLSVEESLDTVIEAVGKRIPSEGRDTALTMWRGFIREQVSPRDSATLQTLRDCRALGLKIGVLSDCGDETARFFRESELHHYVHHAVFSCEAGRMKPHPENYQQICRELQVSPPQCLYLGDGESDELHGAARVGMSPILLRIDKEIAAEGLPEGARYWSGPVITAVEEIWLVLNAPR